jgi:cellulose synthase operon protein YhjU
MAIGGLVVLFVVYFFAAKKLRRVTPFVFAAMLLPLVPFTRSPGPPAPDKLSIPFPVDDTPAPATEATANAVAAPPTPTITASSSTPLPKSAVPVDITPSPIAAKVAAEPAKAAPAAEVQEPVASSVSGPPTEAALTAMLNSFYRQEAARTVSFAAKEPDAPFDIIFLQICSLSWDDLDFTKERGNPLFKRFDIVFTNFSSAATYSGPAAIRALRGSCGQTKHSALYDSAAPQCLTFNNLQKAGFDSQFAMNHDGRFGGFLADVRERGGMKAAAFDTKGVPPYLQSFDGSPIHDDYAVLSRWWAKRLQAPAGSVALYYNSVSLHDGNRYADGRPGNSMEIYRPRLTRLLGDLDRFFSELQASGRRAVVVFVPEHGAALRGDKIQIVGMREIPSPRISTVPVGIKLIGLEENPARKSLTVSKPTSYFAVSQLLSGFIRATPFGKNSSSLEQYVRELPATEFVAENNDLVVARRGKQYFIRSKGAAWIEYDPSE